MPIFEFQSKDGQIIEKYFKAGKCPKSIQHKKVKYYRIYSIPAVMIDASKPKTVGALADKNSREREKLYGSPKEPKLPWWRKSKKIDRSLGRMTPKQKERYILEGKK